MFDRRFLRYVAVGLLSAAVDLACLELLLRLRLGYEVALTLAFLAGLAVNYLLHVAYTFGARIRVPMQAFRFATVVAINYLLTLAMVKIGHEWLAVPVLAAKIASLPCVAVNGFLLSKYWVFRPGPAALDP